MHDRGKNRTQSRIHESFPALPFFWKQSAVVKTETQCIIFSLIFQELCESRGGRPGLSVLTNLLVSVDVKLY